jgi:hypothetical protein
MIAIFCDSTNSNKVTAFFYEHSILNLPVRGRLFSDFILTLDARPPEREFAMADIARELSRNFAPHFGVAGTGSSGFEIAKAIILLKGFYATYGVVYIGYFGFSIDFIFLKINLFINRDFEVFIK